MRTLTEEEIEGYVKRGEWSSTVGCYRYEVAGVNLFSDITGTEDNIAALPRLPLLHNLRRCGINPLCQPAPAVETGMMDNWQASNGFKADNCRLQQFCGYQQVW